MKSKLSGHFSLHAVNAETGEQRALGEFENLILNGGLNRLGSGGVATHCSVGAGSTAPAITDSGLQTLVATTSSATGSTGGASATSPYYGFRTKTWRFDMGAAAGNLTEVGVGWSGGLFSRSLIKDSNGDPTTVTVLANEYLDVTYTLRVYAPVGDVTFTAVIGGITHDCVMRAARATGGAAWGLEALDRGVHFGIASGNSHSSVWNGSLGTVLQSPGGSGSGASDITNAYVNNSLEATGYVSLALDGGNLSGGISAMELLSGLGAYQFSFDPPIAKDNTKTLRIDVALSWDRQ